MEDKTNCTGSPACRQKCAAALLPFLGGFIAALALGWLVFPSLMYDSETQPFFFSHATHMDKAGAVCFDCHSVRSDGSFTGIPQNDVCMSCHDGVLTPEPGQNSSPVEKAAYQAEKSFVENYLNPGKPVPWRRHQSQPQNVFFSHPAHFAKCYTCHLTMQGKLSLGTPEKPRKLCATCHISLEKLDKDTPVETNILTGYSSGTLKMAECERCHSNPGHFNADGRGRTFANNACFTCHK